jgi:hypothetical protein
VGHKVQDSGVGGGGFAGANPGPVELHPGVLEHSDELLASGLVGAASALLEQHLEQSPDDGRALRALGRIRMLQHRPNEAADLLQRALRAFRRAQATRLDGAPALALGGIVKAETVDTNDIQFIEEQHQSALRRRDSFSDADTDTATDSAVLPSADGTSTDAPVDRASDEDALSDDECGEASPQDKEPLVAVPDMTVEDLSPEQPEVVAEVQEAFEAQPEIAEALAEFASMVDAREWETQDVIEDAFERDDAWRETEPEGVEFEEAPTSLEIAEVRTGRLSRAERARQVANEVANRYGWDQEGRDILERVFDEYWWNSAKRAIERELEGGLEPRELQLALEARAIWHQRSEFWNSFPREGFGYVNTYPFPHLPWPTALQLVRSFDGYADPEEVDHFLSELFEQWYYDERRIAEHGSFLAYVKYRTQRREGDSLPGWCSFERNVSDAEESPYDEEVEAIRAELRQKQDLFRLGVPVNGRDQRPDVPMLRSDFSNDDHEW